MKIAIAHDFLNTFGGAERVALALSEVFPEAPIFTLFINQKRIGSLFKDKKIITSSLQKKLELLNFRHKYFLSSMSQAVEEFNFSDFDVVISSSSAWMKGILTKPDTLHICYCHTPTRFLWTESGAYLKQHNLGFFRKIIVNRILSSLRIWDRLAADRVDYWLAISNVTRERIKKYYKKDAEVIYPPVDTSSFNISKTKKDFFLVVSRLSAYKMVDLAIDAFNKLGLNLVIIGDGEERKKLEKKARGNIKFLGFMNDSEILKYYKECRAFIFPTFDEDFGLTPIEAMACGKTVIAAGRGGTKETIIEGVTGEFFNKEDPDYLVGTIKLFLDKEKNYKPWEIRKQALKFDKKIFAEKIKKLVEEKYNSLNKEI